MKRVLGKVGLQAVVVLSSILLSGCNSSSSNVAQNTNPIGEERATITSDNVDVILATSVSGIDKLASLVDGVVEQLPTFSSKNRSITDIDITTKDCENGGDISVDKLTTSGATLNFTECREKGYLLNGIVVVDSDGDSYDATFKNFNAANSVDDITLTDATAHIVGEDYNFFIATGNATVKGNPIEVQNFTIDKKDRKANTNGSLKSGCVGAWIDIATTESLQYDESDNLTDGQLLVTGNSSDISVSINQDGSVTVLLNGSLYKEYDSVDSLPQYSEYCF
ncbi:hypothetical protein MNB_SV-6-288 [hydrothermal vent metagenome]|uniref:Lipoprotein n=1 Tax=hydrothermal vent metagenome TaxID=652676 RepID=A0A1W1BTJ0_9ZZZZ